MITYELFQTPPGRNYFAAPESMGRGDNIDSAVGLLSSAMGLWQNWTLTSRIRSELTTLQSQIQANLARNSSRGVLVVAQIRISYRQGTLVAPEMSFVSAFIAGVGASATAVISDWVSRPQLTTLGSVPPNPAHGGGEYIKQMYFWCTGR
jgi:hypothetical protein